MENKKKETARIVEQTVLADGIYSMWLQADSAESAKPGQFLSLYCEKGGRLLPRPISICQIKRKERLLRVVYRVVGDGTREFSQKKEGDTIDVVGPLGNGFTNELGTALLIGGGIGIPPLLGLAEKLREMGSEVTTVLGYRDNALFLETEFERHSAVYVASEDGSAGTKGNVLDAIKEHELTAETIYACGPIPMLRGVQEFALSNRIRAQLSMEERMACGVGACLACVCQSREVDGHSHVKNKRVCKDGPVFDAGDIIL